MLIDADARRITYLRVSVTANCNLACAYCLPHGKHGFLPHENFLSADDFVRIVSVFADLGVERVRITGGEPLLRKDILEIVGGIRALPGVREVVLSTNGMLLEKLAEPLRAAGISGVNVSVDSLDPDIFRTMTAGGDLHRVLAGLEKAIEVGMRPIKINTVILRGVNEEDIERCADLSTRYPVVVRFIELMPTGDNHEEHGARYVSNDEVRARLRADGAWRETVVSERAGPARYFSRGDGKGTIGFVSPLSHNFCSNCNRLRLTAKGELRTCLFASDDIALAPHLAAPDWRARIEATIQDALRTKAPSHYLNEGRWGNMISFVNVGG